ncbi:MAG TPA: efflux RND transporter periplasmic adaptor subunit [Bryobacteraceae bacterium]|nr:efflux RND transporter periplasmic adaptor subunit [Bryobacteraceae bacterium]
MIKPFLAAVPPLVWLAGCSQAPQETHAATSGPSIAVQSAPVSVLEWPSTYEATGTVRARTSASIAAKLMGYVREVRVQSGDRVKEGQLLVVLDPRDIEANVLRSEAAREEVKNAFPEAENGVLAAKASLDLAQVTFKRMQDLYHKKSISDQEFDEASARLKSAQAVYEIACAKRAQLDPKLAQVEQEVRAAQINQSYAEIVAPFDGRVTSKTVEPGNLAMPGATLLTIERDGGYRLEASVEESRLGAIHVGQTATVKLDRGLTLTGKVSEILPEIDPAARTGTVKIDLPAVSELRSGAFGRVLFGGGTRSAITIPAAAVSERGQLQSVFVAEHGIANTRLVTLGARVGDRVEVLSGLNQGEMVIVPVRQGLTDGTPVETRP